MSMPGAGSISASHMKSLKPTSAPSLKPRLGIQRLHLGRTAGQHRALVDVALVGDLAGVGAGRVGQHQRARHGHRAAAAFAPQRGQRVGNALAQFDFWQLARLRRREDQRPGLGAVVAGDHHVLRQRGQRGHDLHAQRAHADPGAGGELEVLGHAAVELHAGFGPRLVGQQPGVADAVVALVVEGLRRQVRCVAVAGEDRHAAHTHLQLLAVGDELQLHARQRQADDTRRGRASSARW
jgi:hypothetical protein